MKLAKLLPLRVYYLCLLNVIISISIREKHELYKKKPLSTKDLEPINLNKIKTINDSERKY